MAESYQQAIAAFKAADQNGDGMLTRDEFRQAVTRMRSSPQATLWSNPKVEALFDSLDNDRDGHLNRAEFDELLRTLMPAAPLMMAPAPVVFAVPPIMPKMSVRATPPPDLKIERSYMKLMTYIGFSLLFLITFIPLWSATFLLDNPTYLVFAPVEPIWSMVIVAMILAMIIIVYTVLDARIAISRMPGCGCFFQPIELPDMDIDIDIDVPTVHLALWERIMNLMTGLHIPGYGKVPLEAVLAGILAIFLVSHWVLYPSIHFSIFSIPGIGPLLKHVWAPIHHFLQQIMIAFGPMFNFSCFLSLSVIVNGSNAAAGVVLACWATYVFYAFCVVAFVKEQSTLPHLRGAPAVACVWSVYVLLLGILLVIFGSSIASGAHHVENDIYDKCATGSATKHVYSESQHLQAMRLVPTCAEFLSVEDCVDYVTNADKNSLYLKAMEKEHQCRGFCYNQAAVTATTLPINSATNVTAIANATASTLYSKQPYSISCDGEAARSMNGPVHGTGTQIHYAGVFFILVAISVIALRSMHFRLLRLHEQDGQADMKLGNSGPMQPPSYGAIDYTFGGAMQPQPQRVYLPNSHEISRQQYEQHYGA